MSYFLLRDDSWELVDAEESSGSLDSLGIIWGLSYERDAGAGKHVNAALALLETDKAEELASQVAFEDTDATIDGEGVSVWAEHSPQDDHLVATHLRWKATGGVAWLTVYETEPADALPLLSRVEDVPKAEWDAAAADILDEGESTS